MRRLERDDEVFVDDQCCRNCRWWNRDVLTDHLKCGNRLSEKRGKQTEGRDWCWRWQKDRRPG